MLSRPRTQPYAQLLFGAAAIVTIIGILVADPVQLGWQVYAAVGIIVAGCVVMVVADRLKPVRGTAWLALVPLLDIVACMPLREAAQGILPGAGFLILFPIGWLAFAFPLGILIAGVALSVLIPITDLLQGDVTPARGGWAIALVMPVLLALFASALVAIARDLRREQRRALDARGRMGEALKSSARNSATLRALGDATPDALVVFDIAGKPLFVNTVAMQWARRGQAVRSLITPFPAEIYGPDRTTRFELGPHFLTGLRDGEFSQPQRAWIGPPGDQIAITYTARPVVVDGEIVAHVLVGNDVSELLRAIDVRDRFLDTVGHELRSPLTVILGNAELVLDDETAQPHDRPRWDVVNRSAHRLLRLVDRLIAAGRAHLEPRTGDADVTAVVAAALADAAELAEERMIDLASAGTEGLRASIVARDLQQIIGELTANALRFTPAGGSVVIDTYRDRGDVVVEVRDTGVGMTSEERAQAFDRFFRSDHARRQAVPGAGLGLSIAQSLAESNGAALTLDPGLEGGTTASLRVPESTPSVPGP